ncbi:MAG: GNAT family N-acetyltransferase, partial [bacterium]
MHQAAGPRLRIDHILRHPRIRPTVARWIFDEWWRDKPGHSPATLDARLKQACDPDRVPLSLVALLEGRPVGTVNLVENDNESRPDLTPWLAALLVVPELRGRGIGSDLIRTLVAEAKRLGNGRLYLGTDIRVYYQRFGAQVHEEVKGDYCIMRLDTRAWTDRSRSDLRGGLPGRE